MEDGLGLVCQQAGSGLRTWTRLRGHRHHCSGNSAGDCCRGSDCGRTGRPGSEEEEERGEELVGTYALFGAVRQDRDAGSVDI